MELLTPLAKAEPQISILNILKFIAGKAVFCLELGIEARKRSRSKSPRGMCFGISITLSMM